MHYKAARGIRTYDISIRDSHVIASDTELEARAIVSFRILVVDHVYIPIVFSYSHTLCLSELRER